MLRLFLAAGFSLLILVPAHAAQCGGDFNAFLASMAREAQAAGVSSATVQSAFAGVTQDQNVLAFDRRQRATFRQSLDQYVATRVTQGRISRARSLMQKHAQLLSRVQQQYGVPKELLLAIWGMESDFGTGDMG